MGDHEFTVRVLGATQLDGVPLRSRAVDAVLCWTVLNSGRPVRLDACGRALWPDLAAVAAARRAREAARTLVTLSPGTFRTAGNQLDLDVGTELVDEHAFRAAVASERGGDRADEQSRLGRALGWWRGEPYGPLQHLPVAQRRIDELLESRLRATERHFALQLEAADYETIARLRGAVLRDPQRERLWRLLAIGLYLCSRQGEGLAEIERCRRTLALRGERTSPALDALQVAILRGDREAVRAAA